MSPFLALMSALSWGTADFLGGIATRKSGRVLSVIILSQLAGVALVVVALLFLGGDLVDGDIGWAAAAGMGGGVGLVLLYRGLSIGTMSVIAPLSAITAAVVPVAWGLLTGERPSLPATIGIPLALAAIALVSGAHLKGFLSSSGLLEALGAGIGFGAFFILIANTESAELWSLTFARVASIVLLLAVALLTRVPMRPGKGVGWLIVGAGTLDTAANLLFLLAERRGLLTLVAVVSSLYPASTVILARIVLDERITKAQWIGLGLAALSVGLISAG